MSPAPGYGPDDVDSSYATAPTRTIRADGEQIAYRELGTGSGTPVVFFHHLAATLDDWDPLVIDAIARRHRVIVFDQPGVGASTGAVPDTVEAMADDAGAFLDALGLEHVDVIGFSLGGMVAQALALARPDMIRRLVLAGTGPAGGRGIDSVPGVTYRAMLRGALTRTDSKEYLFFNRDVVGKTAAREFIRRLKERSTDRDTPITVRAFRTQLTAITTWGRAQASDLSCLTQPILVVNGDHDKMVPSALSEDLHRRLPDSRLVIYPNSGHGAIFQHHDQFTREVLTHLTGPTTPTEGTP